MKIADGLLEKVSERNNFDVIILPEMAFLGYKFDDKEDILPFLEICNEGKTFEW